MAQGLTLPLKTSIGRLKRLFGDEYIELLIKTALGGADSTNPFQDIGLGEWMIFEINEKLTQGEIRTRIELIFASLEADQLARLDNPRVDLTFVKEGEELFADLTYTNMETQERVSIQVPIPGA